MRHQRHLAGPMLAVPAIVLMLGILTSGTASGACPQQPPVPEGCPLFKEEQKCIIEINKNFAKVAKTQGKDICACIKDQGTGRLTGITVEECLTADRKGRVAKAAAKLKQKVSAKCAAVPRFGTFGLFDPNQVNQLLDPNFPISQLAIDKELTLIHRIFGSDLVAVIASQVDPNDVDMNEKNRAKCQVNAAKAVKKCQDAKLRQFIRCTKGLKFFLSASEFEATCLVARACSTKLSKKLSKKCSSVDLEAAFPGECSDSENLTDLGECLDRIVECEVCMALNKVTGLGRDCDLFDDGLANGSCGEVLPPSACGDTFPMCDGACPPDAACVDDGLGACVCLPSGSPPCECGTPCTFDCGPFGGPVMGVCGIVSSSLPPPDCFCTAICPGLPPTCPFVGPSMCPMPLEPCILHCPGGGSVPGTCDIPLPEGCLCTNIGDGPCP